MASSTKPTVILVPGAWHSGPIHYRPIVDRLRREGYEVDPLSMPSTCDDPKPSGWKDDIDHIAHAIEHAADRGKDIVLVMHSRGGFVGADAAKGLSKADRSDQGKPGGIVRLVYICAFAAAEGLSCWMATGGPEDWQNVQGKITTCTRVEETFYNDVAPEMIEEAKRHIKPMPSTCFCSAASYAAWKHIPSTYLVCENDNAIPLQAQEMMIGQPGANFTVERCAASHSPFLSMPDFTVDVIRRAAGEKV